MASPNIKNMDMPSEKTGKLFVISTPIGHLDDITYRAVGILRSVDRIAAEDTRRTKLLLKKYNITKPLISYHDFNKEKKAPSIIQHISRGESIALVSDAGTPGVSDPGYRLIRKAIDECIPVIPIPGPSAILAGLSASGLPTDSFVFEGFVEARGSRREKQIERLKDEERTIVMFESPYRILKSLETILNILGNRQICVARELTKIYEEWIRGDVKEVLDQLKKRKSVKGEITLIIQGKGKRTKKGKDPIS
jgi:16S rRNA (cytidine1402-2'-O)-methyltransferase